MTDHGKSLNPVLIESDEDSGRQMTKANLNKKIKVEGGEAGQPSVRGVTELDKEKLILAVWESKKNGLCNSGGPITNEWPRVISRYNAMRGRPHEIRKLRKNTWKSIKDNWRKFYDLSNMTGVKFNKEEGYVDMEDSWWESIIEVCTTMLLSFILFLFHLVRHLNVAGRSKVQIILGNKVPTIHEII
ncbi:hypothetical protein AXF42_Ash008592 [Apostasia shenzhenica]|uniref:Uncharacterized protein n=1 Tax=Apostasia shenzhenica TaxID=1088818 RepID=A0A2I0B1T4_9ASPA|nr:hypothetical protein AXF42_Ash008592 [Apostasia shenzhenica]